MSEDSCTLSAEGRKTVWRITECGDLGQSPKVFFLIDGRAEIRVLTERL